MAALRLGDAAGAFDSKAVEGGDHVLAALACGADYPGGGGTSTGFEGLNGTLGGVVEGSLIFLLWGLFVLFVVEGLTEGPSDGGRLATSPARFVQGHWEGVLSGRSLSHLGVREGCGGIGYLDLTQ